MRKRGKNKKGLSEVVTTILIVLVAIVAVIIVWNIIKYMLEKQDTDPGLITSDLKFREVKAYGYNVEMKIKRNVGAGNVVGLKFVFENKTKTYVYSYNSGINELEERIILVDLTGNLSNATKVEVYPIILSQKGNNLTGPLKDTYTFKGTETQAPSTPIINFDLLWPTATQVNVIQNRFFNVKVQACCKNADCENVDVSLDPVTTTYYYPNSTGSALYAIASSATPPTGMADTLVTVAEDIAAASWDENTRYMVPVVPPSTYMGGRANFSISESAASVTAINFTVQSYCSGTGCIGMALYLWNLSSGSYVGGVSGGAGAEEQLSLAYNYVGVGTDFVDSNGYVNGITISIGANLAQSAYIDVMQLAVTSSTTNKGLISTTAGATPFYTNESNPRTINLNQDKCQNITFLVNATGTLGSSYAFFAYANRTAKLATGNITNEWNVSIVAAVADTSATIDPTGDGATLEWGSTGAAHYTEIDDGIRQPTEPDINDYISAYSGPLTDIVTSTLANVASVSQIIVWTNSNSAVSYVNVSVSKDGTNWETAQYLTGPGWSSRTFNVSWTIGGTFTLYTKYHSDPAVAWPIIRASYAVVTYIA